MITQAILPVAGLGTRFLPWTAAVPKELLPIGNRPIIAHIVDECLDSGITDICFVISRGKELIPRYFTGNPELASELQKRGKGDLLTHLQRYDDVNFHVVYQDEQHGDGHAILHAADWLKDDAVAVLFGDDLFTGADPGIKQLIEANGKLPGGERGAMVALEQIDRSRTGRYGIVDVERDHATHPEIKVIKGMVEKPDPANAPSLLGIVGRYILPRSIFDTLRTMDASHEKEARIIDALVTHLGTTPIHGLICEGKRIDTGTPEGYREAVIALG